MARFPSYNKKDFKITSNFLARDTDSSDVVRVPGQSIIDNIDQGQPFQDLETQVNLRVLKLDSMANFAGFVGVEENQQVSLKGWHPASDVGGGVFYWDGSQAKSNHNGGTIVSPTVPWTTTTADFLNAVGETDSGGAGCWVRVDIGYLSTEMFGGGVGVADNSPSWSKLLSTNPGHAHFPNVGSYVFLSSSDHDSDIKITATEGAIIDCTNAGYTGGYWTKFNGALSQIEDLGSNVAKGDRTLTFASAPSLSPGDVFIIFNPTISSWSAYRTVYFAGEFCEVVSVTGSTVVVAGELYDSYNTGDVDVYRIDSISVDVSGITVNGDLSTSLIDMEFCRDSFLRGIKSNHKNNSCIKLQRSYNCYVLESAIHNEGDGGDDYGISISNCQAITVSGGNIYSRRHATATGGDSQVGAVTCRNIRFVDLTLSNDINSGTHCADFHGNTEDGKYVNCEIYGGATWQGKNNGYINCRIGNVLAGPCILTAEVVGGDLYAIDCRFHSAIDPFSTGRGLIDIGGNSSSLRAETVDDITFRVKGGNIYGRNFSGPTSLLIMRNKGSNNKVNIELTDLEVDVDLYGQVVFTALDSGTADSDFIIVDKLKSRGGPASAILALHSASAYLSFPHRMQKQSGQEQLTTSIAASSVTGAPVVYKWVYPRNPNIAMSRTNRGYAGNRIGTAYASPANTTGLTPAVATDDGVNFSVATTIDVNWLATIDET